MGEDIGIERGITHAPLPSVTELTAVLWRSIRLVWAADHVRFMVSIGQQILGAALLGMEILVAQRLLAGFLSRATVGQLIFPAAVLVILFAVSGVSAALGSSQRQALGHRVASYATSRILDATAAAGLADFDEPEFHDRLARASASQMRPFHLTQGLLQLLQSLASVAAVTVALLLLHPLLLVLVVAAFIPLGIISAGSAKGVFDVTAWWSSKERERAYVFRLLSERPAAKEIRAFGITAELRRRHDLLYSQFLGDLARVLRGNAIKGAVASLVSAALAGGLLTALSVLVVAGQVSVSEAGAALTAMLLLGSFVPQLVYGATQVLESALFVSDLDGFIRERLVGSEPTRAGDPAPPFESLKLDRVTFSYPMASSVAVDEVTLELRRGEVIAIVGENGSGKTTTAKLACGLYAPISGKILWNGSDMADLNPESLRRQVSVIFQDFIRYQFPARDNIGLGEVGRLDDLDSVVAAGHQAGAHEFITRLPGGYDTQLGPGFDGGVDLSEGQWQRIALARAFFRDAPVVVLDEPTASLDPRAEFDIFRRVREMAAGRGLILISHRFANVREADRIYVMSAGRVVEQGSHDSLMAANGLYAELYSLQAAGFAADAPSRR